MDKTTRFGVSLDAALLSDFDEYIRKKGYTNRSEAIRDLIRDKLVERDWEVGSTIVAGTVTVVYDHHRLDLPARLNDLQHDHHNLVISTVHVHLDRHNCLEVIILKGRAIDVKAFGERLISQRGIKHGKLTLTTTGYGLV